MKDHIAQLHVQLQVNEQAQENAAMRRMLDRSSLYNAIRRVKFGNYDYDSQRSEDEQKEQTDHATA